MCAGAYMILLIGHQKESDMAHAQKTDTGTELNEYQNYLISRGLSTATINQYLERLRHFFEWWGSASDMHLVTGEELVLYQHNACKVDTTPCLQTLKKAFSVLRSWFDYLMEKGFLQKNPAVGFPISEEEGVSKASVMPRITEVEARQLLECINVTTFRGSRDATMITVLLDTGMHLSELLQITPSGIDCEHGTISVLRRGRPVFYQIVPETAAKIVEHLDRYPAGPKDPVFHGSDAKRITRQAAWKAIRAHAKRAGIEKKIMPSSFARSKSSIAVVESFRDKMARLRGVVDLLGR